jgi:hypothetical protein
LITETGLFGRVIERAKEIETGPGGLSAGMFIGNPFTDVPSLQTYAFVVTDGDAAHAERGALELARAFWEHHEKMTVPLSTLDEMVAIVTGHSGAGTLGLVDAADATSSGASGDSNSVVGALLDAGYRGRVLAPIVDAPAVEAAFKAGVGGTVFTTLGGKLDPAAPRAGPRPAPRRWPVSQRVVRGGVAGRPDGRPRGGERHVGGGEPGCESLRPLLLPRPWPGPTPLRWRRHQVAPLSAPHVCRLVCADDQHRCARLVER